VYINITAHVGGSYGSWQENYDWAAPRIDYYGAQEAPAGLELYFSRSGDTVTLETVVNLTESIAGDTYTVWMVVYEDTVSSYEFVVRDGDRSPGTLSITSPDQSETFTWEFDISGSWDENDLWAAAWIERGTPRQIMQATVRELDWGQANIQEATFGQIKAMDF
jgi:hypothetical protein